jgi:hypothetical protein
MKLIKQSTPIHSRDINRDYRNSELLFHASTHKRLDSEFSHKKKTRTTD